MLRKSKCSAMINSEVFQVILTKIVECESCSMNMIRQRHERQCLVDTGALEVYIIIILYHNFLFHFGKLMFD